MRYTNTEWDIDPKTKNLPPKIIQPQNRKLGRQFLAQKGGNMTIPTMVSLNEASGQTGLSYDYLRKLCLQKKIVYVRAGCKYLVNLEKLVEYLNQGEKVDG